MSDIDVLLAQYNESPSATLKATWCAQTARVCPVGFYTRQGIIIALKELELWVIARPVDSFMIPGQCFTRRWLSVTEAEGPIGQPIPITCLTKLDGAPAIRYVIPNPIQTAKIVSPFEKVLVVERGGPEEW